MKSFRTVTLSALVILAGSVLLHAQGDAQKTYTAKCTSCHAPDGSGSVIGKKLGARDWKSPEVQQMSDADLTTVITNGKNKMPAYGKTLKEAEIKDLVAYVRTLGKAK